MWRLGFPGDGQCVWHMYLRCYFSGNSLALLSLWSDQGDLPYHCWSGARDQRALLVFSGLMECLAPSWDEAGCDSLRTLSCCSSRLDLKVEKSCHLTSPRRLGDVGRSSWLFSFCSVGAGTRNLEHIRCSLILTELSFLSSLVNPLAFLLAPSSKKYVFNCCLFLTLQMCLVLCFLSLFWFIRQRKNTFLSHLILLGFQWGVGMWGC